MFEKSSEVRRTSYLQLSELLSSGFYLLTSFDNRSILKSEVLRLRSANEEVKVACCEYGFGSEEVPGDRIVPADDEC